MEINAEFIADMQNGFYPCGKEYKYTVLLKTKEKIAKRIMNLAEKHYWHLTHCGHCAKLPETEKGTNLRKVLK